MKPESSSGIMTRSHDSCGHMTQISPWRHMSITPAGDQTQDRLAYLMRQYHFSEGRREKVIRLEDLFQKKLSVGSFEATVKTALTTTCYKLPPALIDH